MSRPTSLIPRFPGVFFNRGMEWEIMDYLQLEQVQDWLKGASNWKTAVDREFEKIRFASTLPDAANPPREIFRGGDGKCHLKCKETGEVSEAGTVAMRCKASLKEFESQTASLGEDVIQLPAVRDLTGILRLWIKHGSPLIFGTNARSGVLSEFFPSLCEADAIKRRAFEAIDEAGRRKLDEAGRGDRPSSSTDHLDETDLRILQAVYDQKATIETGKQTTYSEIAVEATGDKYATSESIKKRGRRLVVLGFLSSKRGAGIWLTEEGEKRCRKGNP